MITSVKMTKDEDIPYFPNWGYNKSDIFSTGYWSRTNTLIYFINKEYIIQRPVFGEKTWDIITDKHILEHESTLMVRMSIIL